MFVYKLLSYDNITTEHVMQPYFIIHTQEKTEELSYSKLAQWQETIYR